MPALPPAGRDVPSQSPRGAGPLRPILIFRPCFFYPLGKVSLTRFFGVTIGSRRTARCCIPRGASHPTPESRCPGVIRVVDTGLRFLRGSPISASTNK